MFALICHPATPCSTISASSVQIEWTGEGLLLRWRLAGNMRAVRLPEPQRPGPADELWRHTCLEAFISAEGSPGYREFNLSPSGQWAVYDFSAYRQRNEAFRPAAAPTIALHCDEHDLELDALLPRGLLTNGGTLGLSAVVEETDGTLSYWALSHPSERPDFHRREAFILKLPSLTP